MRALMAQTRVEVVLTLRRGESVLLTLGIPVLILAFFSTVDVLPTPAEVGDPVEFLAPGVLALAVVSTAFVGLAIATGFEREYLVLKRLGSTPLGRGRLLGAKTAAVAAVMVVQVAVLGGLGAGLGWRPDLGGLGAAAAAAALATVAFGGLGFLMAGRLPALATLAAANGTYLILLLLSGMVVPLDELPGPVRSSSRLLPSTALAEILHSSVGAASAIPGRAWLVLATWAVAAPLLAARTFRWG